MESTRYAVPGWGVGELWTRDALVLAHDFDFGSEGGQVRVVPLGTKATFLDARPEPTPGGQDGVAEDVVVRVRGLLNGEEVAFGDVEIDLSWATPFQCAVAQTLRRVPWGEVVSYGELAALAGHPGAARAVGTFCAHNRFALIVPCHRVVAADGIGGYGPDGAGIKRRLLALEGSVP